MKIMIHKIHKGAEFNEVEEGGSYYIVGRGQSIHDYSTVHFPTDIRSCEVCHTGPDGDNYKTQPSRDACGSCHDKVDFKTGENHGPGLPQSSDKDCSSCHQATISSEFDASIPGAHVIERRAPSLSGVNFEILSVTNMAPSEYPTVTYTIIDDGGDPISLDETDRVRFVVAGPSKDFEEYWRDNGGLDSFITATVPTATPLRARFPRKPQNPTESGSRGVDSPISMKSTRRYGTQASTMSTTSRSPTASRFRGGQ